MVVVYNKVEYGPAIQTMLKMVKAGSRPIRGGSGDGCAECGEKTETKWGIVGRIVHVVPRTPAGLELGDFVLLQSECVLSALQHARSAMVP